MITVRYLVTSVPKAVSFYVDVLGFSLKQQFGPAMAMVCRDELTLWLAGPLSRWLMVLSRSPVAGTASSCR